MSHLPKNPFCDVCAKAKVQRTQKRKKVVKLVPDDIAKKAPVKFCEQMIGDHFIKNGRGVDGEEEDPNFLTDTVTVVLYDRGANWLAVYPKATENSLPQN